MATHLLVWLVLLSVYHKLSSTACGNVEISFTGKKHCKFCKMYLNNIHFNKFSIRRVPFKSKLSDECLLIIKDIFNFRCERVTKHGCEWNYNGQGLQYELLAGPLFIVIYTLAGIPLGLWADVYNRKKLLGAAVIFWSTMTILMGLVKEYWQLAILRFGLGIG